MIEKMKTIASTAFSRGLDLIYPPSLYCICCGKIIDSSRTYRLCNECMDGMKWIGSRTCLKCGKRLSEVNPGTVCFSCREHPHLYDRGYTCAEYGTHERAIIFALKYDGRTDIAGTIGEIMADRMLADFSNKELTEMYDMVLPVPVHQHKKSKRGYNQAALIARSFAGRTGLKCDDDIIVRIKETHVMRSLGPEQRRENIRGAFAIRRHRMKELHGKSILLIDDIYTTGATVDEIARVIKAPATDASDMTRCGASCVDVLTFAAGADMVKSI